MLFTFDPILGTLAVIAAGTVAFLAFRVLDRHQRRRDG
jgi:hypothetical protein